MIIPFLGKLSVAQTIASAQTDDSQNVMQVAAVDYANLTDAWLVIDTNVIATGDGSDEYKFQLVLAKEAALNNIKEVISRTVIDVADKSIATAGRHILAVNIGKMLKDMLDDDGSDYPFIGLIITISSGAQIVIDAVLSTTEPQTEMHRQVVTSNVSVPTNA